VFASVYTTWSGLSIEQIAGKATSHLNAKIANSEPALEQLLHHTPPDGSFFEEKKTGLYLFRNDSLIFWNNAQWEMNEKPAAFVNKMGMVRLKHGYFLYCKKVENNETALALNLIKPAYRLQNNYLRNDFSDWLQIPTDIQFDSTGTAEVKAGNQVLFRLSGKEANYYLPETDNEGLLIFYAGLLVTLVALLLFVKQGLSDGLFALAVTAPFLARALLLWLRQPTFLYRTFLYDPRLFGNAQSFANGFLGDILLNGLLLLFAAAAFHFHFKATDNKLRYWLYSGSLLAFILLIAMQFNSVLISLVNNSVFDFNFLNILSIKPAVFIALSTVFFLGLALFLFASKLVTLWADRPAGWLYLLLAGALLCLVQHFSMPGLGFPENFWLILLLPLIYFARRVSGLNTGLALGLFILFISVVTSAFLNHYIDKNQALDQKVLMHRLAERQDEILESEFADLPEKVKEDESLRNLIDLLPNSEKEIEQKLRQKYFSGYFDRYEIEFSLFDKDCNPMLPAKNAVLLNEGFFEDRIRYYSEKIMDGLYFVKDYPKNTQYIVKLATGNDTLFALLEAKQFEEAGSFPDLFLDQSLQKQDKLKNFSYAVYRSGLNTSHFGTFNYPYFYRDSTVLSQSTPGYVHRYFEPDADTHIVISTPIKSWRYLFTYNSYILLLFSLLGYCAHLGYSFIFTTEFRGASLTRRVQTTIISLLVLAMSAVGLTSGSLVTGQFESENKKQLEEKTGVIITELSRQFTPNQLFEEAQKELLNSRLKEYSRLFNTPISLFTKRGMLFNTSDPKLYELGLAASYANPQAFYKLGNNLSTAVCVSEKAGTLSYLSLYTPIFGTDKQVAGFINLPYFARQSTLAAELSQIISALINVYVILFVLSIVAGLILSGYITQPLRLIKQQLARITLGKQNEKISWNSNDEIGRLVGEYNDMLVKLEESANLLARSERESAWREMAKQVAHEIKNPLTPMKLNLQYLQHLMKSNPGDFKEKFEKASAGIIEQIDALASIATEFSNFAKLPAASLQVIDLGELSSLAVNVFDDKSGSVKIKNHIAQKEIRVMGDREQCLRVFNNILKNALQATEDVADPLIEIDFVQNETKITVAIKDNGCGIDAEMKPKLFSPNFTTKSTGSGLGLAMVKNIMEGFGGHIRFDSEKGQGSTFYLEFVNAG
jgi:signal transduction histidine kinase